MGSLGKYQDEKDVMGVTVTNCTLRNTTNGLRIKTWADSRPTQASKISFQDIILDAVKNPIIIDQSYGSKDKSKPVSIRTSNKNVTKRSIKTSFDNDHDHVIISYSEFEVLLLMLFMCLICMQPSQVKISEVNYKNIRGTTISVVPVSLQCSAKVPCEGVKLEEIDMSFVGSEKKKAAFGNSCLNAKITTVGKQIPPACAV